METGERLTFLEARRALESIARGWCESAEVPYHTAIFCLSPRDRRLFRRYIDKDYKGGRSEKPEHFWELDSWMRDNLTVQEFPGLEADDVMGVLSNPDHIIISSDKDMKTVPGWLYSPYKDQKVLVDLMDADAWWMTQTLWGDATDGYKGANGCGEKGAKEIVARFTDGQITFDQLWADVVATYTKVRGPNGSKTQTLQDAYRNAMLARILRPFDWKGNNNVEYMIGGAPVRFNTKFQAA